MSAAEDTIASLRNNGSEIIAVGAVMASLAIVSVVLRLLAKAWNEKEYGIDDILIGLALLWYLLTESLVLRGMCFSIALTYQIVLWLVLTLIQLSTSAGKLPMELLPNMLLS